MLEIGSKYHRNGKMYTVKSIETEPNQDNQTIITLSDSCDKETKVSLMKLATQYSGYISSTVYPSHE